MALRDFYSLCETVVQPLDEALALDDSLIESVDKADEHMLSARHAALVKLDQDLPTIPAVLAQEMEQVRLSLLELLMENSLASALLHEQIAGNIGEGIDYSIMHNARHPTNDIVQNQNFVQDILHAAASTLEEQTIATDNGENASSDSECSRIHFFPAVLIRIAGQILDAADPPLFIDQSYKRKVREYSRRLQALRQQMIVNNTGLVAFVAYKHKTTNLSFDDLMQEGIVGLIRAVDRFDPNREIRFSTYAVFWIKQAISRLILKQEKVVRLPVALAEKASAVFEVMRSCYLEHNRWPSQTELLSQCGLSPEEIKTISSYFLATHSLDAAISEENDDHTLMATLQQQQFALPLNELIDNNLSLYLSNVVASLPEKEATILNMRFGLKNHTEMTLQAIADQLNVTRERVRQIQNQALNKLKQQFGYELLPFLEPNDG